MSIIWLFFELCCPKRSKTQFLLHNHNCPGRQALRINHQHRTEANRFSDSRSPKEDTDGTFRGGSPAPPSAGGVSFSPVITVQWHRPAQLMPPAAIKSDRFQKFNRAFGFNLCSLSSPLRVVFAA
ncbi:hypothetical protein EVAR_28556_1 [Eumeta japonica]|uniref:Uncharacterized protein n=1 Tax=Eumeta variegata TaxID=151549 RepID=A0A4C1UY21_EUMVA|nr:hypothetical protein EVAR_28556_1 [Eumeta japonica]